MGNLQKQVARLFVEFGDEVLDCVRDSKGVNVEDVRHAMVGPLRAYIAAAAENTSTSLPAPVAQNAANGDGGSYGSTTQQPGSPVVAAVAEMPAPPNGLGTP